MTPQPQRRHNDSGWRGPLLKILLTILGFVAAGWVSVMEVHRSKDYPALSERVAVLAQAQAAQSAAIEVKLDTIVGLLRARRYEPHREAVKP